MKRRIFDKSCLEEMKQVEDGREYIFEYIDCGHVRQDVCINVNGEMFVKAASCCNDVKTGKALDCYGRYDNENNYVLVVKRLNGTLEVGR